MPQFIKRLRNLVRAAACRLSPSPADDELAGTIRQEVGALLCDTGTNEKFLPAHWTRSCGLQPPTLKMNWSEISRWTDPRYQQLFCAVGILGINTGFNGLSFGTAALHNGYYPGMPDAEIYGR